MIRERTDAERWQFVRDNLTQTHSLKMDGMHSYRFRQPLGQGLSIDQVIDRLIQEAEDWAQTQQDRGQ